MRLRRDRRSVVMQQLRSATPVARKTHRCDWCYVTIQPGTRYHRSTNIYDDRLYDWLSCLACEALCPEAWDWAGRPDEGIGEDMFAEWAHDHHTDAEHGQAARDYLARRGGRL